MSQVPGASSSESSLWLTSKKASRQNSKKEDGRGSGDKLHQHERNVGRITSFGAWGATSRAAFPIGPNTLVDNRKEDARKNAILKMLHRKKYTIDFHGYFRYEALKELEDIIISLTHNLKGKFNQQFTVITGKGIHSPDGKPVIKETVLDYLKRNHVKHQEQEDNSGRINIIVDKKSCDLL